jgi:sarcosine oxidase subunit alpha
LNASPPDDSRTLPPGAPRGRAISIDFEGSALRGCEGEPLAVALFAAGVRTLARSPKYHRPRGFFCLEGHCGSCLMRIDGRPNRRACLVPVRAGLRCERQNAFPDADVDLLRAADWLFPDGMDHHRMMTSTRVGNQLFLKLVRQMGGSGLLPDAPAAPLSPARDEEVDLCVVGAGPAGLAAARAAAEAAPGVRVILVDDQDRPGGSLLAEPGGTARAGAEAAATSARGVQIWSGATAIAYYPEDGPDAGDGGLTETGASRLSDGPPGVLAVTMREGLVRVRARRYLYATGGYDQNLPFPGGDRPGVVSARACGRLVFRWGVRPGRRVVLLAEADGPSPFAAMLTAGLERLGIPVVAGTTNAPPRFDLKRDLVAVDTLPAPASELPRQHGARAGLAPAAGGFAVAVDATYVAVPQVYAAGDVTGYRGPSAAAAAGAAAGRHAARTL